MLTEFLIDLQWQTIIPGVQSAAFTMNKPDEFFPCSLSPVLKPSHMEVFFCRSGSLLLGRKSASPISIGPQEILLLSDCSDLSSVQITSAIDGICISVDCKIISESLNYTSKIVGEIFPRLDVIAEFMHRQQGCLRLHSSAWNRTLFSGLDSIAEEDRLRYCVIKTVEIFYLLCSKSCLLSEESIPAGYLTNTVSEIQSYMENHLDEKLTIPAMSQQFNISPTAFKSCFRSMYGLPVHTWLQARRMQRAAEFLVSSPMTVLQVAQAVGYDGVSQFNVVFKRRFGMTPSQYRKMSNSGRFEPIQ